MGTLNVDLSGVEYSTGGGGWHAFPAGEYRMIVTESELKPLNSGNGTRLAVTFGIAAGDHNGKSHFESYNVQHSNPVAEKIAHEHLSMLADACGLPRDFLKTIGSEALDGKVVIAEMTRQKSRNEKYGDADGFENKVRAFAPAAPQSAPAATAPPQAAAPSEFDDVPF